MDFCSEILKKARELNRKIVLPEADDDRVLLAASKVLEDKGAGIILLGEKDEILAKARELSANLDGAEFINPAKTELFGDFVSTLVELRKSKGLSEQEARELMLRGEYFGTMLVYKGLAHAMVSGAKTTTADTIRPALQFVKMKDGVSTVSGAFIISLNDKLWFFADCAICPKPSIDELASIAIATASTAKSFGVEPKVAFLSYATGNSAKGEMVDYIKSAVARAKELAPELEIDGPMQFDAAVDPVVAKAKLPNSSVAGRADVFVFPDLNCGNICYKAVQRAGGALAVGPILQGLRKPVNDLSRGCMVDDIINTILVSALQD